MSNGLERVKRNDLHGEEALTIATMQGQRIWVEGPIFRNKFLFQL